ncbi:MAG: nucleoside 2-deoxyribosyltransferase [Thermoproteota archaeon]|nr:MAG: nucleoside 2-deoxyribosyltransferase [Candidatus Korarchaeota archaeon]RLG56211.1 MAG: nucleoside 2-deoxyribosyltransferase [Candidatus Korarchaeota archaeon]
MLQARCSWLKSGSSETSMPLRVYVAAPIRGDRRALNSVRALVSMLRELGHEVLTEHVAQGSSESASSEEVYRRNIRLLSECDLVVAEVSYPSHGVGFEVCKALSMGKKVIAVVESSRKAFLSAMIAGAPGIQVLEYSSIEELWAKLIEALAYLK